MNALSDANRSGVCRRIHLIASTFCLAGLLLVSDHALGSQNRPCSQKAVDRLEDEAGDVRSWSELAAFYRHYRACKIDDASVQEGVSDSVARLLANHWKTLPEASKLFARDPGFEEFALAGINITDSTDDLNRIDSLAEKQCPVPLSVLCRKIRKAIQENN